MKKSIQFIAAILLLSTILTSCSNTDTDEELQLFQEQELFADDTGGDEPPPLPLPTPPPGEETVN